MTINQTLGQISGPRKDAILRGSNIVWPINQVHIFIQKEQSVAKLMELNIHMAKSRMQSESDGIVYLMNYSLGAFERNKFGI